MIAYRFAAKEATIKAVSTRTLSWHDIAIHNGLVKPVLVVKSASCAIDSALDAELRHRDQSTGKIEDDETEGQVARLSISHDGEYATAVVLAVDDHVEEAYNTKSPPDTHPVDT